MADADSRELPIFELPIVLLPTEQVPLHIFEERYQRMVAHCLDSHEPLGIVFRDDDGPKQVGCTARIVEVLERMEDGRSNILIAGENPFRVLSRTETPDFPAGEVELIDHEIEDGEGDATAAEEAQTDFADVVERATKERPPADDLEGQGAYDLASRVDLPPETKQALLELRNETERLEMLSRAFKSLLEVLDRTLKIRDRAQQNGKVKFSSQ